MIKGRCNIKVGTFNVYWNNKSGRKAGNVTIYEYRNGQQEEKTLERYFILSRFG